MRSVTWVTFYAGLLIGASFMSLTAALFIFAPRALASAYTFDFDVIALASLLIPVAGFFQIFDGLQVVSAGALRGACDTRAPLIVNIVGFWCIGLPVSWLLGFKLGYGPIGLWWGLVAGLGAVAVFLLIRLAWKFHGDIRRVDVD